MYCVPRSRAYNFRTIHGNNDDWRPGGERIRIRRMTVASTEINPAICCEIIPKGPRIEVQRLVATKESQSDREGTLIDLPLLKHQALLQNRDSSLQSAHGSRRQVRKRVKSNSL